MTFSFFKTLGLPFLLILSGFLFLHCNRTIDSILPHTELIFPNEAGKFSISIVIDTTYNSAGPLEETFYKREELQGLEQDLDGRMVRKIQTWRSDVSLGTSYDFKISKLYTQYYDSTETGTRFAERIEENKRYLILKFPVSEGIKWNGNLYNILDAQEYEYTHVDTTVTVRGISFANCVVVTQKDNQEGLIRKEFAYEIYAPEIGRIKKYDRTLVFDGPNGEFNPSESRIYLEEIVEHN